MEKSITKKVLSVFLAIALILCTIPAISLPVFAESEFSLTFKLSEDGESYEVSGYEGSISGELVIPSEYDGKPVLEIGDHAFSDCTDLLSVVISEGITFIGHGSFIRCTGLVSVTIPNTVRAIGLDAFQNCTSLTSISIPDSVSCIWDGAFSYCTSLSSVLIPDSVVSIGGIAFCNCSPNLIISGYANSEAEKYALANSISFVSIGEASHISYILDTSGNEYIFYKCETNFQGEFTILGEYNGKPVTKIGREAFADCKAVTSIIIPDSVSYIADDAFINCTNLRKIYVDSENSYYCTLDNVLFNKSKTEIIRYPQAKVGNSYTIPNSVTSIEGEAFSGCTNLKEVKIPDSVTSISGGAFSGCTSLEKIEIPDSVMSIGYYAFDNCSQNLVINGYTYSAAHDYAMENSIEFNSLGETSPLRFELNHEYYYESGNTGYAVSGCSKSYSGDITIPAEYNGSPVTKISDIAFNWHENITSITVSEGITEIGAGAFADCTNLTSVTIPKSVICMDYAFDGKNDNNPNLVIKGYTYSAAYDYAMVNSISFVSLGNVSAFRYKLRDDGSYCFLRCSVGYKGAVNIPRKYNGKEVTEIRDEAFADCKEVTSVVIPGSVKYIGDGVFNNCTKLSRISVPSSNDYYYAVNGVLFNKSQTEIIKYPQAKTDESYTVPDGVNVIGDYAFSNCENLSSVEIPDGVIEVGSCSFKGCRNLQYVSLPETLEWLYMQSFKDCVNLVSVNIPNALSEISYGVFEGCISLESVTIPSEITAICDRAFLGCSSLKTLAIPSSITAIGSAAFSECSSLLSVVIPDGVTEICDNTFSDCSSLEFVKISKNAERIEWSAFRGCSSLATVEIPAGVISIGNYAFSDCANLENIEIPSSVTEIGMEVFNGCLNLTSIVIPYGVSIIPDGTFRFCTSLSSVKIPDGVIEIGGGSFEDCVSLKSITLPNTITYIGFEAFSGCSKLASLKLPDSLTSIGACAFKGCTGIQSIALPDSVSEVRYGVFKECQNLKKVKMSSEIEAIADEMFLGCVNLQSIEIPENVMYIGECAFQNCKSLTSVTIPDGATSIEMSAFYGCENLVSVTIPESVNSIAFDAFSDCSPNLVISGYKYSTAYEHAIENSIRFNALGEVSPLKFALNYDETGYVVSKCSNSYSGDIVIPEEYNGMPVTEIDSFAFNYCKNLESVMMPDSVLNIGDGAFLECERLRSVTISENLRYITNYMFSGCHSLTSIMIPDSVKGVGSFAFEECESLSSITIPEQVDEIGLCAFSGCKKLGRIIVSPDNETYASQNGVLFNKDKTTLLKYPEGRVATSYLVPESVTCIATDAIENCTSLKNLVISSNVNTIESGNFRSCLNLENISVASDNCNYADENGVLYNNDKTELIKYPSGKIDDVYEIADNVLKISPYAFSEASNLLYVELPDSLINIGDSAFLSCVGLETITIPSSIISIEANTFSGCKNLVSVTIPDTVVKIGDSVFYDCTSLEQITIPSSVTEIGEHVFACCTSLTSVTIPDTVTSIGDYAFRGCLNLESITLPKGITMIDRGIFSACRNLTSVAIPDTVTWIRDNAFIYCTSLRSIVIPRSVTDIEEFAFCNSQLKTIYGYAGSYAESFANDYGYEFIALDDLVAVIDPGTEILVWGSSLDNSKLNIKQLAECGNETAYRIALIKDGKETELDSIVTVKIPISEGVDGKTCCVYRIENNGEITTNMEASFKDGFLEFTATTLGEFIVTTGEISNVSGDLNNDGVCDVIDAQLCEKAVSGHIELSMRQKYSASGDAFCDVDASLYQRVVNEALKGA